MTAMPYARGELATGVGVSQKWQLSSLYQISLEAVMRFIAVLFLSLFLLSSCATLESAWNSTVDWVSGDSEESTATEK